MVDENHDDMDRFFDAARATAPQPSADLLARIMADAEAQQPVVTDRPESAGLAGRVRGLLATIGGWPAMAGMVTATAAGLWIGIYPPAGLADIAASYLGDTSEYLSDYMPTMAGLEIGG